MKIAISGKGGVGKSTIAAALALVLAEKGHRVLAIDADPDANLAHALGIGRDARAGISTIAKQKALIEERTGAKVGQYGQMFRLNPTVSDIADTFGYVHRGVKLVVLGAVAGGGSGCACPENTLLSALVRELVLNRDEFLVMDMEAGIEHLGRATVQGVDALVVVAEPGQRAADTALRIRGMAADIGIARTGLVMNRLRGEADERFLREALPDFPVWGRIPFTEGMAARDRDGVAVLDGMEPAVRECFDRLADGLLKMH